MVSKRSLLTVHRWIGLTMGLFLMMQGISGAAVAWRDELLLAQAPRATPSDSPFPIDVAIDLTRHRYPHAAIRRFDFPEEAGAAAMVRITANNSDRLLFFAPGNGALLTDRSARSYPSEWLYDYHAHLLAGENGRFAIAAMAFGLLLMSATGAWLWWPGKQRVRRSLQVRLKGPPHRLISELHRVLGVFLFSLLALVALTGFVLAMMVDVRGWVGAEMPPTAPKDAPTGRLQPLQQSVAQARRLFPGQPIKSVRLSGENLRFVRIIVAANGAQRWSVDETWIDRDGGRTVATHRAATAPTANASLAWILPLHSWNWLGLPGRLLASGLAAALAGFSLSGIYLWARRKLIRRGSSAAAIASRLGEENG